MSEIEKRNKRYATVKKTAEIYKEAFSVSGLRWIIFHAESNGFNSCIRHVGRKILIDLDQFELWIDQRNNSHQTGVC